jgi:crossover junction endodeoxyribonuclease RuvC
MFDSCVLGVDPGVASVGLAILAKRSGHLEIVWTHNLRTPADLAVPARLRRIYEGVAAALTEHTPEALAIERLMWNRNVGSAMDVARASGVVILAAADAGIPVEEYAPLEVKMAATGSGNASKDQVRAMLAKLHGLGGIPDQPDVADAVAVGFCHMQESRLRRAAREAAAR